MSKHPKTRRDWLRILGATGVIGLAGCTGGNGNNEQSQQSNSNDGSSGQGSHKGSTTVALATDPTDGTWKVYGGVTPYYTNILEPLIWVTDDMKLKPWLATEWEATGEKTWEFTLRDDVTFHNGELLTAEAVKFSFEAILNEWSWAPGWVHLEPKNSVKVLDEHTVEFTTTDPFPSFPGTIAHNMIAIQHPSRDRKKNEVIGTGPFQVTNRKNKQFVETKAFDDYWNGDVGLSSLTFQVISDPNTRALALKDHEVDIAYEPPKSQLKNLKNSEKTNAITQLSPGAGAARLNMYKSPTDDVKLRKALNYAVPQKLIVDEVLNGVGVPAKGPIAKSIYWSAHDKLPNYGPNMDKAKSLVKESKYSGQKLKMLVGKDMVDGNLIAQVLQQQFDQIGVSIEIQIMEESAFDDAVRNGKAHIELNESGTNSGAADYLIYESFHSEGDMNERLKEKEGTGLYNPGKKVDNLIEKGFQTANKQKKGRHYEEALQIVMSQAAVIPLYYGEYIVGTYNDVESLDLRPIPEMVQWSGLKHGN
ncbi:ABC transporter substrate-binding protein [Haladaptatus pallidirubidus]|uniref:ABC transporter substrate-binding protein n=2 Tax=Haladaptatus pallidirubidus TaxID=1008152 RepID=A0AAV3UPY2_9EURY|nr:ABC transporter substrate-binding protein [Haladaptatus pallidirubidus]